MDPERRRSPRIAVAGDRESVIRHPTHLINSRALIFALACDMTSALATALRSADFSGGAVAL